MLRRQIGCAVGLLHESSLRSEVSEVGVRWVLATGGGGKLTVVVSPLASGFDLRGKRSLLTKSHTGDCITV